MMITESILVSLADFVTNTACLGTWGFGNGVYGRYEEMASDISFVFFYYPEGPGQALYLRGTIPYHTPWPGLKGRGCTAAKRVIDQAARLALTAQAGERVILGKVMRGYFWFPRGGGEGDIDSVGSGSMSDKAGERQTAARELVKPILFSFVDQGRGRDEE